MQYVKKLITAIGGLILAISVWSFIRNPANPNIAPSMAAGFTINYIGAIVFPAIGVLLLMIDYRIPFVAGPILSLILLATVQFITNQVKRASR